MRRSTELWMVVDAESIGLHGEAFAVAFLVFDELGTRLDEETFSCNPATAAGAEDDRAWVNAHVPLQSLPLNCAHPREVRDRWWDAWMAWKRRGAKLLADCGWPVETGLLSACVRDEPDRGWDGPYPLHELGTLLEVLGHDPTATTERRPDELPEHLPSNDCRQSARRFLEARTRLRFALSHA